jgi:hypothetical protein
MLEAVRTSETSVDIQLRTRQYTEDSELHTRRRENLKYHTHTVMFYTACSLMAILRNDHQSSLVYHIDGDAEVRHRCLSRGFIQTLIFKELLLLFMSMGWDYISELRPPMDLLNIPQMIYEDGEPRWNDIDRGNLKNCEKNLSECHSVHHMDWPERKPRPPL